MQRSRQTLKGKHQAPFPGLEEKLYMWINYSFFKEKLTQIQI